MKTYPTRATILAVLAAADVGRAVADEVNYESGCARRALSTGTRLAVTGRTAPFDLVAKPFVKK